MPRFSKKTLQAVRDLIESVDGCHRVEIKPVSEYSPKGQWQDCQGVVSGEWVDQHGPEMTDDDYWGAVTWKLGEFYLIAHFAT
jgi:hypothetical protein